MHRSLCVFFRSLKPLLADNSWGPCFIDECFANFRGPGEAIGVHSGATPPIARNAYAYRSWGGDHAGSRFMSMQVILPPAPGASNEGRSSPLLVPLPAVSWPWVLAWGLLEPSRRDGENAQKTGKNGEKMGEIRPKECEPRELTKDQLEGEPEGLLALRRAQRQAADGVAHLLPARARHGE